MIANLFGRLLCIGKKVNLSCRFILEQIMLSKKKNRANNNLPFIIYCESMVNLTLLI